jgi:hypothetical protein
MKLSNNFSVRYFPWICSYSSLKRTSLFTSLRNVIKHCSLFISKARNIADWRWNMTHVWTFRKNFLFWPMSLCSSPKFYQHFGGTFRRHLQGRIICRARDLYEAGGKQMEVKFSSVRRSASNDLHSVTSRRQNSRFGLKALTPDDEPA